MTDRRVDLDRALVRQGGLTEFARIAFERFEGAPYVEGWATRAVCRELENAYHAQSLDLVINLPPSHSKSSLLSLFQLWAWTLNPNHRFFFGSYASELGKREGGKIVALAQTEWFRARWPNVEFVDSKKGPLPDPNTSILNTSKGGLRFVSTPRGIVTGWHFDTQLFDDPHKPEDMGAAAIALASSWLRRTMGSRWRTKRQVRIVGMQRLDVRDMSAQVIADAALPGASPLVKLVLPLEFDPVIATGQDERTEHGQLLAPERFDVKAIASLKARIGSEGARASQLQQNPMGAAGKVYRREWFRKWTTLPTHFDLLGDFWDCTFDDEGQDPDYVAGQRWGRKGPDYYLVARAATLRRNFPATLKAIKAFALSGIGHPTFTVVEKKANGAAVLSTFRKSVSGMIAYEPHGSKVERAVSSSVYVEAGNVWVGPNDDDLIELATSFPSIPHDDEIDAMSMGINYLSGKGAGFASLPTDLDLETILGIK